MGFAEWCVALKGVENKLGLRDLVLCIRSRCEVKDRVCGFCEGCVWAGMGLGLSGWGGNGEMFRMDAV